VSEGEPEPEAERPPVQAERPSVLREVARRTGASARVLLRDSDSLVAGPPLVNPKAKDAAHFPAARHHYQVLGEIARGGMGVVLKAHDTELGREVAIKVLDERFSSEGAVLQRFVEEAQIGGQLQHPGVVPVYELGMLDDQRPFIAMKLVKGQTLSALLSDRKSPAAGRRRFLTIFESVCQTVAYAHSKGVIHRDLKPANVLVGAFGEVQVGDWGLAKVLGKGGVEDEERARRSHLTVIETVRSGPGSAGSDSMVGSVMGTPAYMPPEQAMGEIEKIDERSDVFSLGAILCEILTGQPPYIGAEKERTVVQAAHGRIDAARERLEACEADAELKALALECLAPARTVRPRNADEVARRVHDYMVSADERAHAAELAAAEAHVKVAAARRERLLTLGLAAAVVVGVVSVGAFLRSRTLNRIEQADQVRSRLDDGVEQVLALRTSGQLTEALEVARSTAKTVEESPWAGEEQRERVARLVAQTEARVRDAATQTDLEQRNARILGELEELRLDQLEMMLAGRQEELAARYTAAFERYGAPVDLEDPDLFFEAVRWSGIEVGLAAALDCWAWVVRDISGWDALEARLLTLLAMDLDPDPGRTEMRNAILEVDANKLVAMALDARARGHSAETQFTILSALFELPRSVRPRDPDISEFRDVAARLYPQDFLMNCIEAFSLRRKGRHDAAIPPLRAAIALRPDNARLQRYLAEALDEVGDHPPAIDLYARSRDLGHDPSGANYRIGLSLWDLGEYAAAAGAIGRALAGDASRRDYVVDREAVRYLAGQVSREALVARVEELGRPTSSELVGMALALLEHPDATRDDVERALSACRRARSNGTTDYYLSLCFCMALLELDRVEEALTELEAWEQQLNAVDLSRTAIEASFRARCYQRLGDRERAMSELGRAQRMAAMLISEGGARWSSSRLVRLLRAAEDEIGG